MAQIVADAELAKQLSALDGPVTIVDASGTVLAVCTPPVRFPHTPYSREEIDARRTEARENPGAGRKLADFWKEFLAAQGGAP